MPETVPTPPLLSRRWTNPLPVVVIGTTIWLVLGAIAVILGAQWHALAAVSWAGVGVGILGGALFAWQLRAARRGARGAQQGLVDHRPPHA